MVLYPLTIFCAGILLALAIFPVGLLLGFSSYWDHISGDTATNWIGYEALARDLWRWPLFRTTLLAPPMGTNILFTDPIPLMALAGKVVFKLTGWLPNYFGPWLLIAYGLQPLTLYGLFRALRMTRPAAFAGGLLGLLVPAFIYRGHYPLQGHWALLAAFTVYFLIVRDGRRLHVALGAALTVIFVLINPYLLVMVAGIYFAALGDGAWRQRITPLTAGTAALVVVVSVVALAMLFGFIEPGEPPAATGGFGLYSMNLLSPVVPQLSAWPGRAGFVLDATTGQYEGYNYLGLGILALIVLAVALAARPLWAFMRAHPLLCMVALILALYSLSTQVYAGNHLILQLPFGEFRPFAAFAGAFRSSGRFFWPLGYLLLISASYALFTQLGPRRFVLIALVVLAVQAVDIRPLAVYVAARAAPAEARINRAEWMEAVSLHDELVILPQFLCTSWVNRPFIYELGLVAVRLGIPTNSAIVNRYNLDCDAEKTAYIRSLRTLAIGHNPLVVVFNDEVPPSALRLAAVTAGLTCRHATFAYVCSGDETHPAVLALGEPLGPDETVALGELLSTEPNGRGREFLAQGWSEGGAWGVWGVGPESAIVTSLARPICGDVLMRATIIPFAFGDHFVQSADVSLNGRELPRQTLSEAGVQVLSLRMANSGCVDMVNVSLRFSDLKSPRRLGMSADERPLSWGLQSFSFQAAQ